jgi:sucrose-6-phosphate hydrolase SacC (GH32 family)
MTIKPAEEYCKYTFYASDDLKNWESVYETGALAPGTGTTDGEYIFESPGVGDKRFWRAEGKDGLK